MDGSGFGSKKLESYAAGPQLLVSHRKPAQEGPSETLRTIEIN